MDSITHLTLGACAGEIILGKKLGKRALLWGALAQNLPDIDSFAELFYPADKALVIHRGITHSLLFAVVAGLLLAGLAKKIHHKTVMSFALLAFFFCFQLALHDLLDTCNSYGTGLLEPFSHQRFSINVLFVADPLFTLSLIIATLLLIFSRSENKNRTRWAYTAILISAVYLCFAGLSKLYIGNRVKESFNFQRINPSGYFTTPTPLNSMLWYVVANADSNYFTGYSSIWDDAGKPVNYQRHPKNYALLKTQSDPGMLKNLVTFADNYYTLSKEGNEVFINILRFGQIHGWQFPDAGFVLSYPLSARDNRASLLQKRRLAGWNYKSVKIYLDRIAGKTP